MSYDENSFLQGIAAGMAIREKSKFDRPCLLFESAGAFSIATGNSAKNWDGTLEYSLDGDNWSEWSGTSAIGSGAGNVLYLRGTGNSRLSGSYPYINLVFTGSGISVRGNIETLLDWRSTAAGSHPIMASYCFANLFKGATGLVSAPALPAVTLAESCYNSMFWGCTGLAVPPALPATVLEASCYAWMFYGCTGLLSAPALPAMTLAYGCYWSMFEGCTALTRAPSLPAFLAIGRSGYYCYNSMFKGCTSLTTLPKIQASYFPFDGCVSMFEGCSAIMLSETQTGSYTTPYRLPDSGTASVVSGAFKDMFSGTGGSFTGTPSANTTYYTSNEVVERFSRPFLPDEYQEIEYIDFTPPAGFLVTIPASFKAEAKFAADALALNRCVFGYRTSASNDADFIMGTNANGGAFFFVQGTGIDDALRVPYSIGVPAIIRGFAYNFRTNAFIGKYSDASSYRYGFDGKIYYVKGWDIDGNLSFKFVPCYLKSDNTLGFYDVVAGEFYSTLDASGGGSVSPGPDVT